MTLRLGILTTHPIQYQVPWFRLLAARPEIDLTVFFCMMPDARQQGDGFGVAFQWDIPLLDGYRYEVLRNVAAFPSVTHYSGCDTPEIGNIVRNHQFDAFIVNGWVVKSCLQLLLACRRYGVPCIVRGESNALRSRAWWKSMVHRLLLRHYVAFLNIGGSNRDFYLHNGVPPEKIFFAPYCVENERFASAAEALRPERAALRDGWGIAPEAFTFLFCAKFIDKKRPLDLLNAVEIAVRDLRMPKKGLHLLMVGDGELREECERFVHEHGLPVTFTGFLNQSELPRAYAAADCLVLPSDYGETWGLVVNEAMACGLPAIVSDRVGCHPDLIRQERTGAVFPFGDSTALAEQLLLFAGEPAKSHLMGEEARKLISRYSYQELLKGTIASLCFVCGDKPAEMGYS
jgi:glycosyltransferase involved in cell wall biosynthesis